ATAVLARPEEADVARVEEPALPGLQKSEFRRERRVVVRDPLLALGLVGGEPGAQPVPEALVLGRGGEVHAARVARRRRGRHRGAGTRRGGTPARCARGPIGVDCPGPMTRSLDLKALPNVRDPFPVYEWLRDHDPVHWSTTLNGWVVTRFADVIEIFNQPIRFSSDRFRKIDERYASRRPAVKAVGDVLGQWL